MAKFFAPINGITVGGTEIVIADDAVGTVPLPSNAGFVAVVRSDPPNVNFSAFLVYDEDSLITLSTGVASTVDNQNNTTLTGTTGSDGDMVLAVNGANFAVENRTGATRTFKVMFL